jgi:hypothetical protein
MMGSQCDTCRTFEPGTPNGWLILLSVQPASPFAAMLGGSGGGAEPVGTFCSPQCVADWAYVLAAAGRTL